MKKARYLIWATLAVCAAIACGALFWLGKNVFELHALRDAEIRLAREIELTQNCESVIFRNWAQFLRHLDAIPEEHFSPHAAKEIARKSQLNASIKPLTELPPAKNISANSGKNFSAYSKNEYIFVLRETSSGKIQGIALLKSELFAGLENTATQSFSHGENVHVRIIPVSEERGFGIIRDLPGAKIELDIASREDAESVAARRAVWLAGACIFAMITAIVVLGLRVFALSEKRYLFASSVSHELKIPIAELHACAEAALNRCRDETLLRDLNAIRSSSRELSGIIENLLFFSRVKDGKFRIAFTEVSVADAVSRIFVRIGEQLLATDTDAVFDVEPRVRQRRLKTSLEILGRILFNLADNAVKYARRTDAENVLNFRVHAKGDLLFIDVEDAGPGISPAIRPHIFQAFERGCERSNIRGLGLGLTISADAAKAVGGTLSLLKTDSSGSIFRLTLPLLPSKLRH